MKNSDGKTVTTKPWQLAEWKETRSGKIGDKCVQCGSSVGPFVLHHLHNLPSFSMVAIVVASDLFDAWLSDQVIEIPKVAVSFCPRCHSRDIRRRKVMKPPWVCNRCREAFDAPKEVMFPDTQERAHLYREFKAANWDVIQLRARSIREKDHERYMSCEDAATFCRKCAFLWDMKGMSLCPNCEVRYKTFRYDFCFVCAKQKGLVRPTMLERMGVTKEQEAEWDSELNQMHST